ncbi:MAG: NgoPII family restriction endonuclease [Symploca sp. SIO2E9]|nr:NgoPII family restriction endonuclease [Symploca sp. SIO2E9]
MNEIHGVYFSETKELGIVNKVDPLNITYLRIRGMWGMQNPISVFDYLNLGDQQNTKFQTIALMKKSKYFSFPEQDRIQIEALSDNKLQINEINIKSPNNPVKLIPAILIKYTI